MLKVVSANGNIFHPKEVVIESCGLTLIFEDDNTLFLSFGGWSGTAPIRITAKDVERALESERAFPHSNTDMGS